MSPKTSPDAPRTGRGRAAALLAAGLVLLAAALPGSAATVTCPPATAAASAPAPASAPCAASSRGIPACGVLVGAAVGGNSDPAPLETALGKTLQIRRTFWGPNGVDKAVTAARQDISAGRIPWLSFKLPYDWRRMADGDGDAWASSLVDRLAALRGPVWIAFHHEPEGDGQIGDWVAMQRHLAPMVHQGSQNVAFTMILTGWHQFHGDPQFSLGALWPGDGMVDLLGFDIYNEFGSLKDGQANTTMLDLGQTYFPQISAFAGAHHTAWGLAETGLTDDAATADPGWLEQSYTAMRRTGGVAFTYFDSSLNSNGNSWELGSGTKRNEFQAILDQAAAPQQPGQSAAPVPATCSPTANRAHP
ncbi:hypothetical protein KIH31_07660 [Paenarthrobacter sp. DKR-5]|uniref:hypothetical protein n=1 Tax=Paenarthrobacter sp. DKR-5 TaxID=2835535 RepID=UPI001BDCB9E7|nr:hypothetical protein [Paenarthrobacter sp. DKR-5]MBT1002477.1 hypothetical protein [Paenarthrobacter sp. DKR-5]